MNQHSELNSWGWNSWFEEHCHCKPSETVARVAAVDRHQLLLIDQHRYFRAKLPGSFMYQHQQSHEYPCVGDWVCVEKQPEGTFGVVSSVFPRKTSLRRKSAGDSADYQMIAANLDYVVIVQSCHFDFNLNRLQRYLVMVQDGGAEPCILLTKTDLVDTATRDALIEAIRSAGIAAPILTMSNLTGSGLNELKQILLPEKTYCFVGSSGVGKSSLINHLTGLDRLETQAVSGTGEGRHTTVRRELIRLDCGALVIDNPGMREFGIIDAALGLESNFSMITSLATQCRYRDCSHTDEPGCAILDAVRSGTISQDSLKNYQKLNDESDFNQMSYAEKRRKDRDFGRFIKSVKKGLKR